MTWIRSAPCWAACLSKDNTQAQCQKHWACCISKKRGFIYEANCIHDPGNPAGDESGRLRRGFPALHRRQPAEHPKHPEHPRQHFPDHPLHHRSPTVGDLTDDLRTQLRRYWQLATKLKEYPEKGKIEYFDYDTNQNYRDGAALAEIYKKLEQMAVLDPYLAQENIFSQLIPPLEEVTRDRQGLLDNFSILEDTMIAIDRTATTPNGETAFREGWFQPEYSAQGDSLNAPVLPITLNGPTSVPDGWTAEYDENGRICLLTTNTGWLQKEEYTYNGQGSLIKIEASSWKGTNFDVLARMRTTEITYDSNGALASAAYKDCWYNNDPSSAEDNLTSLQEDQFLFTCDDQGRLIRLEHLPGDRVSIVDGVPGNVLEPAVYTKDVYDIRYGSYYFYNAE